MLDSVYGVTTNDEGFLNAVFIFPDGISKKSLIYKLEKELGIKIKGNHNFDVEFTEETPYNELIKNMRQWYDYRYNHITEEESIELYAKTYGVGYADADHLHIRLCRKCGRCAERLQTGQKSLESCGMVQGR